MSSGSGAIIRGRSCWLFNFSEEEQTAWINEVEDYTDLLSRKKCPAKGVSVPGYGFFWLCTRFR